MKKLLMITIAVMLIVSSAARATTVDVVLGATDTYSLGGTLSPNINLLSGAVTSSANAGVLSDTWSIPGFYLSPTSSAYGGTYLAVLGGGSATLTLASNQNTFGFLWGSVDAYNTLTLKTTNGNFTITGTQLQNVLNSLAAGVTQSNVIFSDPFGQITSAILTSANNSFEAANFGSAHIAAVPLPGTAGMLVLGLAVLGFIAYRNRKSV
jgi:hypothetical protein